MEKSVPEILEELRRDANEAEWLFSNAGQELQERTAVAGLLRVLGVVYQPEEIVKKGPEPVDVWFREARFQVTEILDKGRPRNLEVKQRAKRIRSAARLQDLITPGVVLNKPIAPLELFELALERSCAKATRYAGACKNIDLLIYVNLRGRHLYPVDPLPDLQPLAAIGWRSVSVIMERFALILWAEPSSPGFLYLRNGEVVEWPSLESVFPHLDACQ